MAIQRYTIRNRASAILRRIRCFFLKLKGYHINSSTIIEGKVKLDKINPNGIYIGSNTLIASGAVILSHEHCKRTIHDQPFLFDTRIGDNCFIGINAIILPGITIGNEVIVGAGAVVTNNVPSFSIVAGNPARVIRTDIEMNSNAALSNWDEKNGWSK